MLKVYLLLFFLLLDFGRVLVGTWDGRLLVLSSSLIKVWATELRSCVKVEVAILGSCPR